MLLVAGRIIDLFKTNMPVEASDWVEQTRCYDESPSHTDPTKEVGIDFDARDTDGILPYYVALYVTHKNVERSFLDGISITARILDHALYIASTKDAASSPTRFGPTALD